MPGSSEEAHTFAASTLSREEKLARLKSGMAATAPRDPSNRLSAPQRRLWELEEHSSSNAMHVFALAYYLDGPLDVSLLAASIAAVAARHRALRLRVAISERGPLISDRQPLLEATEAPALEVRAVSFGPGEDAGARIDALLRAEAERPIDLVIGAGWRSVLFELRPESYVLLLQFHHIFADRWSVGVFMSDLSTAYRTLRAGQSAVEDVLPANQPSVADDSASAANDYWPARFASPPPPLVLPGARRVVAFSDYQGTRVEAVIERETVAAVKAMASSGSTTVFPVLLAAFAATLHSHTGQDDLVLCTSMVGRHRAGTRGVIGYLNNIVPLRLDLRDDFPFSELVARVAMESRAASGHQDVPFHEIAALPELAAARITRCLFTVQNIPGLHLELPGITSRYHDVPNGTANFDLSLFIEEKDGRLELLIDHKSAVLDRVSVDSLREHFAEVLELVTAQPHLRLSELPQHRQPVVVTAEPPTAPANPASAADRNLFEQRMVDAWQRVFRTKEINAASHFFDLGGDSMRAARLFAEIEQEFGHQLPLASLFEAPTPRLLVARMRDEAWVAPWLSLVPVRPAGTRPPLFCVHGGGGNVVAFRSLADCLDDDQPLYCLQAKGLKRGELALVTVEEMANEYLAAIRQIQPRGPYLMLGHSVGAAIAYEMARRFDADGDRVAFLGLLDHPGPQSRLTATDMFRFHLTNLSMLPWRLRTRYVWRGLVWRTYVRKVKQRMKASPEIQAPKPRGEDWELALLEHSLRALRDYVIKPYPGRITLFRARQGSPMVRADPRGGWGGVAGGGVEICEVPGTHLSMLKQPHVRDLGEALSHALRALDLQG